MKNFPYTIMNFQHLKLQIILLLNKFKQINWTELLGSFFDRIAIMELDDEQKTSVALSIKNDIQFEKVYWGELILSLLIATFGLLQNSVAVIIGAMLIAPLLRPIQGMGFAVATGNTQMFWRATKLLFWSVVISIGIAWISIVLVPVQIETSEILARTAPNLYDFFIAIFSAGIAALALSFNRLSASVAGVAMAASLMPPLAVAGIEFGMLHFSQAWGSLLLFLTNLLAIVLVMMVAFWGYGFTPHRQDSGSVFKSMTVVIILVFLIWIPLGSSLSAIAQKAETQTISTNFIQHKLESTLPEAKLSQLQIQKMTKDSVYLFGTIKLPEKVTFFDDIHDQVVLELSDILKKSIVLNLELIRTARLEQKVTPKINIEDQIKVSFRELFHRDMLNASLIQLEVYSDPETQAHNVKAVIIPPAGANIDESIQSNLTEKLSQKFPNQTMNILWNIMGQNSNISDDSSLSSSNSIAKQFKSQVENEWKFFLSNSLDSNVEIKNMDIFWKTNEEPPLSESATPDDLRNKVTEITITFDLNVPETFSAKQAEEFENQLETLITNQSIPTDVQWRLFRFTKFMETTLK